VGAGGTVGVEDGVEEEVMAVPCATDGALVVDDRDVAL
jgi:hypothetical protein